MMKRKTFVGIRLKKCSKDFTNLLREWALLLSCYCDNGHSVMDEFVNFTNFSK